MTEPVKLRYGNTDTFYIPGTRGGLLLDTDWAGTMPRFFRALGEAGLTLGDLSCLLLTHYHPDHMGLAGELQRRGVTLLIAQSQTAFLHFADGIFKKEGRRDFVPVDDGAARVIAFSESRMILREFGILDKVFLDFSIVNSMDYYNGIVFQGAAAEIPFPVLYGGRYDPLPKKMGKDVEAVGFGVYLDEVDNYIGKPRRFDVDYLIVYDSKKEKDAGVRLARVMRKLEKAGFSVRSVRSDQLDNMQQRPRSRKIVNIEAAEKEVPGND